jgi:hypothetical protein
MAVEMLPVDSSAIRSIGYDHQALSLRVEFHSGKVYVYEAVPEAVFQKLKHAESKGKHFIAHIRESYFYHVYGQGTPITGQAVHHAADKSSVKTGGRRLIRFEDS